MVQVFNHYTYVGEVRDSYGGAKCSYSAFLLTQKVDTHKQILKLRLVNIHEGIQSRKTKSI